MRTLLAVFLLLVCDASGRRVTPKQEIRKGVFEAQGKRTQWSQVKSQSRPGTANPSRLKALGVLAMAPVAQGLAVGALNNPGNAPRMHLQGGLGRQNFTRSQPTWMSIQDLKYQHDASDILQSTDDLSATIDKAADTLHSIDHLSPAVDKHNHSLKTAEYKSNVADAVTCMRRDIPQALRFEGDPRRVAPTNWGIYTDSLETVFKAADLMAIKVLKAVIPSWKMNIKGVRENQRALQEVRIVLKALEFSSLEKEADVTASTNIGVDPNTGEEVIESRWIAKVLMRRFQLPQLLPPPPFPFGKPASRKSGTRVVQVEALSRFHLDAEGKIYQHSIDELDLFVDGKPLDSRKLQKFLDFLAVLPKARLPM